MIKRLNIIVLLLLLFFGIIGCEEKVLEIIGEDIVEVGSSIVLTHNYGSSEDEVWESSNEDVAIVFDGMVIGNSVGTVTITLSIGEDVASKTIEVTPVPLNITIVGTNVVVEGKSIQLEAEISIDTEEEVVWKSCDESIAKVNQNGLVRGISVGSTIIEASILGNVSEFAITVIPNDYYIEINSKNIIKIGEQYQLACSDSLNQTANVEWEVSDENIATISSSGLLKGIAEGEVVVVAYMKGNREIFNSFIVKVVLAAPEKIIVSGDNTVTQGKTINLSVEVKGDKVTKEVEWISSNPKVAIVYKGIILGITAGTTTITVYSALDNSVNDSIEITVNKYKAEENSDDDISRVNEIIDNMSLEQKVGQMFVIGFSGTTMPKNLSQAIEQYHFGNVIFMGYNVINPKTLSQLSNDIQSKMLLENGVPAFITIDQEGGRVVRLANGGTHFISNMAMGATGDANNAYLEGQAIAMELRNYGINCDFAPVLDVNNNPENPIIGIRSYSDNPVTVSLFGNQMIKGLQESNVLACSKHFPGHGNTSVDTHYGLPTITSSIDELYQTELAPFISAITNGIDSIMTTHIIFSAIDDKYPATLSEKVLTNLLRGEFGFDGIIFTDGMEMGAVTSNFGGYDKTAIQAIKAGADVITYTTINNPIIAYNSIIQAIKNGEITEERINESVRRILLKKLEYGLLDNCQAKNEDITNLLKEHEQLNVNFAMQSVTQIKGKFNGLDKSKSTLIISPSTNYNLGQGLESNSFANYACNYLKENGFEQVDYLVVDSNVTTTQESQILNKYKNYDQIVIAMSNVKTSKYTNTSKLINKLASNHDNLIVIALDTPYDLLSYSNVKNYICVYGYQKASVIALSKYLNGEFIANGKSPIDESLFN